MGLSEKIFGRGGSASMKSTLGWGQGQMLQSGTSLAQQSMPGTFGTLSTLATQPSSVYSPISDQYYQDVIANPYLAQMEKSWKNIVGQGSRGGQLHGGGFQRQQALFETDKATNLLAQRSGLFEQERQAKMQYDELAKKRQLEALGQQGQLYGTLLGVQGKQAVVKPGTGGLLEKASRTMQFAQGVKDFAA